jgi:acetolactate synthase-1/2/3 large subunit
MTGLATAYMDSSPVVAITGQVPSSMIGTDGFQEMDVVGMATSTTKYTFQPLHAKDVPYSIKAAFHLSTTRRPQPVLVDIPKDVQMQMEDDVEFPESVEFPNYGPLPDPDPAIVKTIARMMLESQRPMVLAGGGVKTANAYHELRTLAELLYAPVVTSFMGKGAFPENHPLSLGCMGMHGSERTNRLLPECDELLVVGSRLSDRTTGKIEKFCPNTKLIHVDADKAEIGKNYRLPVLSLVADARKALAAVAKEVEAGMLGRHRETWVKKAQEVVLAATAHDGNGAYLSGVETVKILRKLLPSKAVVTTEVGQHQMWCEQHFQVIEPRTFLSSGGLGTMGFGFPAAIGAKVARPDVPVLDVAGDGSFMMTENSLATSVEEHIPVTVVILNNRMLGMVAQWQRQFYNNRYSAVCLGKSPDFVKLAEAYGAEGIRIGTIPELESAVNRALQSHVTTVIDVPISPEEDVLPMLPPGAGIKEMIVG